MICKPFSVVVVPFPFTDSAATKKRPALVLSSESFNRQGHSILAMITSKGHHPWPGDSEIMDLDAAGLPVACLVRFKLFTLDNRLIIGRLGALGRKDAASVSAQVSSLLPLSAK